MSDILSKIACCLCGRQIQPNAAAMCMDCLKIEVDLSDLVSRNVDLLQCGKCGRWCIRNNQWVHHELESASLLAMCLKKIPGLDRSDVKILDASWVWTEPHSKRLKVAVDIETGVLDEKVRVAQKILVEFKVANKQCVECIRENTDHTWGACVQLRQRVGHKMSFFHLETCLIKAKLHDLMLDVKVTKEGVDMYFKTKTHAQRIVGFVNSLFPTISKTSKKLIGKDTHSNLHRNEFVISMEVVPLCRFDLIVTTRESGRVPELMLVSQLSTNVHLINPNTLNKIEISATKFFGKPFKPLLTAKNLVKFIILNITPLTAAGATSVFSFRDDDVHVKDKGGVLAEAEVARESDFGYNDIMFTTITHLGHLLKAGDTALGYDLSNLVMDIANERRFSELPHEPQEIILVKKSFEKTREKKRKLRRQRRPRRGRGTEDGFDDTRGAATSDTVGDTKPSADNADEEMELDEGAEQWRMISDSILYGGDADDAALHMELMEEIDDDDEDIAINFSADEVLPPNDDEALAVNDEDGFEDVDDDDENEDV